MNRNSDGEREGEGGREREGGRGREREGEGGKSAARLRKRVLKFCDERLISGLPDEGGKTS
jgi:hypothetical protein